MNARLEGGMQSKNVKGHSGRRSFITNGLDAGVPPEIIAQSTKHKDPKTLMAYAEKSDSILGSAGLQLNKKLKSTNLENTFAGRSILNTSSSSTAIASSSSCSSSIEKAVVQNSSSSVLQDQDKKYSFTFNFN